MSRGLSPDAERQLRIHLERFASEMARNVIGPAMRAARIRRQRGQAMRRKTLTAGRKEPIMNECKGDSMSNTANRYFDRTMHPPVGIMRRLSRRALHAARASEYVWPMALDVTSRIGWAEGDQAWRQLLGELLPLLEWDRKAARDVAHELVRHAERQREFTHPGYDV